MRTGWEPCEPPAQKRGHITGPLAFPAELRAHILLLQRQMILYHNFLRCKDYFFRDSENFLLPICRGYSKINKLSSSACSCGAGLAQWMPVNHVRRGTEQHSAGFSMCREGAGSAAAYGGRFFSAHRKPCRCARARGMPRRKSCLEVVPCIRPFTANGGPRRSRTSSASPTSPRP